MDRSPLCTFEKAIGGELRPGQLGIVIARHGAGKTPFVVGMALDAILRGKKVLHVSLDMKTEHVREFYDQIFAEYVRIAHLTDSKLLLPADREVLYQVLQDQATVWAIALSSAQLIDTINIRRARSMSRWSWSVSVKCAMRTYSAKIWS